MNEDVYLGENSFKLMENIARFTHAARTYGLSDCETFQTVDLYEKMNLHQVILCLFALGRKVKFILLKSPFRSFHISRFLQAQKQGLRGLGPKESERNERNFSEQIINQTHSIISSQYGYNKGATQSGIVFGNPRHI